MIRKILIAALFTAIFSSALFAQASTAAINGTLRDSSGSVIPAASLVLRNVATAVESRTESNAAGIYTFLNILPGQYTLEVSKPGFRTNRLSQFNLAVNQTATIDIVMEVGSVDQSINVEAIGAEVQASTSEVGAVVSRQQVVDLPLNGRNFTQLLSLTPGVAPVSVSQNTGSGFAHPGIGAFIFPAINGQTNRSNFWTLDGITNQGLMLSTPAVNPIVDAIAEFKVQSHNDQAEFGGALGGVVNVATQNGTNQLHGSAWEYVRNNAFDARNTFLPEVTPFRQNQFGFAVGGPVMIPKILDGRNNTFFHGSYQGWRFRRANNALFRVPTAAQLGGNLSDIPQQIYDPFTTRANPNGSGFVRDPFAGNIIPASRIHPGMLAYARATFPVGGAPITADRNALDPSPFKQNQEEYSFRIDRVVTAKDNVFFRMSHSMLDQTASGGRPALASFRTFDAYNIGTSWVHTFSPTLVIQSQFGRLQNEDNQGNRFRSLPSSFAQDVGYNPVFCCSFLDGQSLMPALNIDGWVAGGESLSLNRPSDIWQYKSSLTKIKGSHNFKFGGEWNNMDFLGSPRNASATFRPLQTSNPLSPGGTGNQLASFLLNVPDAAVYRNRSTTVRRGGHMAFYFQDQWKVNQRLTINYGLRYDKTFIPPLGQEGNDNIYTGGYNLQIGQYIIQKQPGSCEELRRAPCVPGGRLPENVVVDPRGKLYHNTNDNWQPRFGFAYRLGQRTAIRSSFGMVFDNYAAVVQTAQNYSAQWPSVGEQLQENLNNPTAAQPTPTFSGLNPFPSGALPQPTPFNQVQWYMDPYFRNPYSMQWNFGVQHQVANDTVLTVNYVGSGSRRLDIGGFYNVATTPGPGDFRQRAPFPYIRPTYYDRSWGRGNYHGLQVLLDKRFREGFAYMINYTYSKSIDIGCSGWYGVEGCSVQNPYKFNNDRSVSGFDLTHVLTMNFVYDLPFGKGKRFSTNSAADYLLGGWRVNGIIRLSSGQPYNLQINGDLANTGNSNYLRLNFLGNPKLDNPTTGRWFDTSLVAAPAPFTFGNSGRYRMRSDGWENFDLSLFREIGLPFLGEGKRLELRFEGFNMFNHPVYAPPNANLSNAQLFGRVTATANQPRQLQLGARFVF